MGGGVIHYSLYYSPPSVVLLFVLFVFWENVLVLLLSNRKMYFHLLIFNFKHVKVVAL